MRTLYMLLPVALAAACAPKRIHEEPILQTGDRVESASCSGETSTRAARPVRGAGRFT